MSTVRENLMAQKYYTPYCGGANCKTVPRTFFNGNQFECLECGWVSSFEPEFIAAYKIKWSKDKQ